MRRFAIVAALTLGVGAATSCSGKGGHDADGDGPRGTASGPAPRLTGKNTDGEYIQLEDFRGQVILLNVWATWCGPCKKELPELQAVHQRYKDQGFTVLGVSIDVPRAHPKVRAMMKEHGLTYPTLLDPGGRRVASYGVVGYPTTFIIDRGGNLRWRRDGIIRPGDPELKDRLELVLGEPAPASP